MNDASIHKDAQRVREIRAASLTGFVEVCYFVGLDPFEMLREAKISPRFLDDPENRHAARPVVEMIEKAASRSHCDAFGLLMAECRSFASIGPLSLLLQHLPTVGEVLAALNQYRRLMNDVASLECMPGTDSTIFCWTVAPGYETTQGTDLAVGVIYRILTEALGGSWAPELVHFRHPPPLDLRSFRRFFHVPIEFDSKFSGYTCANRSLGTAMPDAEPMMADHARRLLDLIPLPDEDSPVSDAAQRAIYLLLPEGGAKLATVAANLGMNERMLQRRLADEVSSFEALLNETRKDMAQRFLIGSERPVGLIAEQLGYSSTGAFTRWFISEFGIPPSTWRKEMRDENRH